MLSASERRDSARLEALYNLLKQEGSSPIGDTLIIATRLYEEIEDTIARHVAEEAMRGIRLLVSRTQLDSILFTVPPKLPRELTDIEYLQLLRIDMAVHELCYSCEMVQNSAEVTGGGSASTRFYLNGIYHYTSSMFLVDTSKFTHKDLPMGGTVIRALYPIGLTSILDPLKNILEEPFGEITFGQAILNLRHSDLVHGDFSPERVEHLINQTQMRNPIQQEQFGHLIWRLYHRLIILHLELFSLLNSSGKDAGIVMLRYVRAKRPK